MSSLSSRAVGNRREAARDVDDHELVRGSRENRCHVHEDLVPGYQSVVGQIEDVRAGEDDLASVMPDVGDPQFGDHGVTGPPSPQDLVADTGHGLFKGVYRVAHTVPADDRIVVDTDEHPTGGHPRGYSVRVEPIYELEEGLGPPARVCHGLPPVC